jgi:HEAT repeat protein
VSYIEFFGVAFFAGTLLFLVLLVARRSYIAHRERRRAGLVAQLRPGAIAFVGGGDDAVPEYHGAEAEVFAELLGNYTRLLRGDARSRIASYYESSGGVDEQLARLRSRWAWKRATAAFTLGDMSSKQAVPGLLAALDDKRRDVRMAATRSLGRLGAVEGIAPIIQAAVAGRLPRDVTGLALFDIGPDAVPHLLELVSSNEPAVRASALELVGLLGAAGDAPPVLDGLSDTAAAVRAASADALGRIGTGEAEARDALVRALDDRVPTVRVAAARALGHTGGQAVADALLPVARGDSFEPARAAAEALARIAPARVVQEAEKPDAGPHLREAADLLSL